MARHLPCFAVLLGLCSPLCGQEESNWPRFLGNTFDGITSVSQPIDWSSGPKFLWSIDVGEGYGMGTVEHGSYFQFDADPSGGERLRRIDLETGKTEWTRSLPLNYRDMYQYENGPRSSPTIAGNQIYTFGVGGRLTCRNLSGDQVWSIDTEEEYGVIQNFFGVGCSPLVLGDLLIVMVGGSPPEDADVGLGNLDRVSPNGSAVVGLDRMTGQERWRCGDDLASYSSPRPIEIGGETLVLVFARGGLLAIDPKLGQVRWRWDHRAEMLESVNAMVPVVDGEHVFVSECYQFGSVLLRASGRSAEVIWRDPPRNRRIQAMRCHWATPILIDGYLYGCSGRNAPDSDFRCIQFMTGEVQWVDPRRVRSSATAVGDHLLVLEERGLLQVIKADPSQMRVVAQWDLSRPADDRPGIRYPCWSAPVVAGRRLLVRGDSKVLCLKLASSTAQ